MTDVSGLDQTSRQVMTVTYKRLALAIEEDLVGHATPDGYRVENVRGLVVDAETELGAWTKAHEAATKRAAWRLAKLQRKVEKPCR